MSVSVVSCVYGSYAGFAQGWAAAIDMLDPAPDLVVVAGDSRARVDVSIVQPRCRWRYPQAYYLNAAIRQVETEWVWIVDIDDFAKPDGLAGLDDVDADVWQVGFERSDGETYLPPRLTNDEYLASSKNVYVAGSMVRTDAFRAVGGFRNLALQDWDLWRRLAAAGYRFEASARTHFHYMRHPHTRGATELTLDRRAEHLEEMFVAA